MNRLYQGNPSWSSFQHIPTFYKYAEHILRPQNNESGEPELNNVGDKYQDNNDLILHNTIINSRWNQISDMMQGFVPPFQDSYKKSLGWISILSLSWNK